MSKEYFNTVIPAQPGWMLIEPVLDGCTVKSVAYSPVIAWAISCGYGDDGMGPLLHFTTPVTTDGNSGTETIILRSPTGEMEETGNMTFNSEVEVIARLQEVCDRWTRLEQRSNKGPELTDEEAHVLTHTLTGSNGEKPYRNYFAANERNLYLPAINSLIERGLMQPGAKAEATEIMYFHCTSAGAAAVGLSLPQDTGHNGPK